MDRRSFIWAAAVLGAEPAFAGAMGVPAGGAVDPNQQVESDVRIQRASAAALAMQRRDWEQGILAQALVESGQEVNAILLAKAAIVQRNTDGRLGVLIEGGPTDPAMGGEAYSQAGEWSGEPEIKQAVQGLLEWIRHGAPRAADGTLYHVFSAPEIWSDGFNAAPPFLAAMGRTDEAIAQIEGFRKRLWNPQVKLLSHVWDEGKMQLKRKEFWGGGNGWAAAGLARVIRRLPQGRDHDRAHLAEFAKDIVEGCLAYQRPDGLFHNVVDDPQTFVETNLAQMLAYTIYQGIIWEWLPRSFLEKAERLKNAARQKMDGFGYVQGVCGAPGFDRPGVSTEGQAFCILMEQSASQAATARPLHG